MVRHGWIVACVVVMGTGAAAFGYGFDGVYVEYWAGGGANEAMLVVDFLNGNNYAFGYRWAGAATGFDMLQAVDAGGAFDFTYTDDPVYGILLDTMSYDGHTMGEGGYWNDDWVGYFTSDDGATWTDYPGLCDSRALADGAWDGWAHQTTGDFPPANKPTTPILPGDANKDRTVETQDFSILKGHFAQDPAVWGDGNFNEDTVVDTQDFSILKDHFGEHAPEPATLALLALGGLIVLRRRPRASGN